MQSDARVPDQQAPAAVETEPAPELVLAARLGGLRYVNDGMPGIRRVSTKKGFRYVDPAGKPLKDEAQLARIRALAIPPAWQDVWICPDPDGHLQATGRDARNRKQYRYHKNWREVRDEAKYERMIGFGLHLPGIRARIDEDTRRQGLSREKVLATVIRLLDVTMMRIGNEEYAQANKSFGLTTLRNRHVSIEGAAVEFRFRGKSGIVHNVKVTEPRLARIVKRMRDLPGQELFQYVDAEGERHSIGSADVNDYLREITGENYTAKDFRTWWGTVEAMQALKAIGPSQGVTEAKRNIKQAIETAAKKLGNTPAICRKCYVHPAVVDAYMTGAMFASGGTEQKAIPGLQPEEVETLLLLQDRLGDMEASRAFTAGAAGCADE